MLIMEPDNREDLFSKSVKAGKRTYFFDIKSTRGKDYYITLTESKKTSENGQDTYQKHKLFLYKEDFDKFLNTLQETIDKARELQKNNTSDQNASSYSGFSLEEI